MKTNLVKSVMALATMLVFGMALTQLNAAEGPKQGAVNGVIETVDVDAKTVKVRLEHSTKTFHVAKNAKIETSDNEKASLGDLKSGDPVTINYREEKDGKLIAERIAPKKPSIGEKEKS